MQEQKEQVLDRLYNFKAAPKPTAVQPGLVLGELRHLDSVGLPPTRDGSVAAATTPTTPVAPGLWTAGLPPKPPSSVAPPAGSPFELPPAALTAPQMDAAAAPKPAPIDLAAVTASADPAAATLMQSALAAMTARSIEQATEVARALGDISPADAEQAATSVLDSLLQH
eukprot:3176893-Prymnesium_polylepis.1